MAIMVLPTFPHLEDILWEKTIKRRESRWGEMLKLGKALEKYGELWRAKKLYELVSF